MHRQLSKTPDSCAETNRRVSDIHSDFVAIAYAMGGSRPQLQVRGRWYEACRNPKEYEPLRPYEMEQEMIDDAVLTVANRGTEAERKAVRAAVEQYFETRCRLALEYLGEVEDADVLKLCTEQIKETGEATSAIVNAISSKSATAFEAAERETLQAENVLERMRDALAAARARFYTPRTMRVLSR